MWNRYELLEIIGEGQTGEVWRAFSREGNTTYALKKLKPDLLRDKDLIRFNREVRHLTRIHHKNLIRIIDFCDDPRRPGYVMEYCSRGDISHLVGESCGNPHLVESVLKQVCLALHELHTSELRIIHRDVKPANVLIGEDGHFKLSDLGFSVSLSQEEQRVTTTSWTSQGFSSPEQIANMADVDERADVFSLGALAFFMLTGSTYDLAWTGHSFISQTVIDERTTGWKFSQILPILLQVNRSHRPRKVGKVLRAMEVLGNRQTQSDDLSDTGAEICNCPECGCAAVRAWNWTQDEARGSCFCLICDYATEGG